MDRTGVHLFFYGCPAEQTWALAEVIATYQLTENWGPSFALARPGVFEEVGPSPWAMGYLEPATEYRGVEVAVGAADEIAEILRTHSPGACWDVWEDPQGEWMGERYIHDPDLGTWCHECDSNGRPRYQPDEVRGWVIEALHAPRDEARRAAAQNKILTEVGDPWLTLGERHPDKRIVQIQPEPEQEART